jgi:glucans biosynthesis protein C
MGLKGKDLSIETLRGFAIVFMIAGHIIGGKLTGMKLEEDSGWRYFYFTFEYLRMPLFTVISGFVYSLRPAGNSNLFRFYRGKARRLLLPMVCVGTLHFMMQHFIPGTNCKLPLSEIWKIYIFPYEHFWFLQSVFLIFLVVGFIDYFKLMGSIRNWLIFFLLAAFFRNLDLPYPNDYFSIDRFVNLMPFFLLGCGIERYPEIFTSKAFLKTILGIFIVAIVFQQYTWFANMALNFEADKLLGLIVACTGITLFFYIRRDIPIMSKIGYYAFGIYLFHVFGTAGSRIFLHELGVQNHFIVFTIGLIFGIGIPILFELLFEKSAILRRLFFGLSK